MLCSAASPYSRPEEDPVLGSGQAMRRSWIEVPYAEEDLTRLEEEVIPVLRSYLERIDEIDRQLEEAQEAGADSAQRAAGSPDPGTSLHPDRAALGRAQTRWPELRPIGRLSWRLPPRTAAAVPPAAPDAQQQEPDRRWLARRSRGSGEGSPWLRWPLAVGKGCASGSAGASPPLPAPLRPRCCWGSLAFFPMAAPQGSVCEIRLLCLHRYQPGVRKGGAAPAAIEWLGKRGKAVKKLRFIPAERAHAIARKLQGQAGTTVSVL